MLVSEIPFENLKEGDKVLTANGLRAIISVLKPYDDGNLIAFEILTSGNETDYIEHSRCSKIEYRGRTWKKN